MNSTALPSRLQSAKDIGNRPDKLVGSATCHVHWSSAAGAFKHVAKALFPLMAQGSKSTWRDPCDLHGSEQSLCRQKWPMMPRSACYNARGVASTRFLLSVCFEIETEQNSFHGGGLVNSKMERGAPPLRRNLYYFPVVVARTVLDFWHAVG